MIKTRLGRDIYAYFHSFLVLFALITFSGTFSFFWAHYGVLNKLMVQDGHLPGGLHSL